MKPTLQKSPTLMLKYKNSAMKLRFYCSKRFREKDKDKIRPKRTNLLNPFCAALANAVGAAVPPLVAALIKGYNHKVRLEVVGVVVSLALLVFGGLGTILGKAPMVKSSLRALIGGWIAMGVTIGLIKCVGYVKE
ncbi:hypothetical protein L6164_020055 [Bauhinia variegata]|uniref:Uncharacterized protein n=1 Tax=Bauhinia variegata TaxID=167791 RepID=A0ACB9MX94_BAUVA|nr:hypothetical protein L6164_020055 [Bauhinia variegata]